MMIGAMLLKVMGGLSNPHPDQQCGGNNQSIDINNRIGFDI